VHGAEIPRQSYLAPAVLSSCKKDSGFRTRTVQLARFPIRPANEAVVCCEKNVYLAAFGAGEMHCVIFGKPGTPQFTSTVNDGIIKFDGLFDEVEKSLGVSRRSELGLRAISASTTPLLTQMFGSLVAKPINASIASAS